MEWTIVVPTHRRQIKEPVLNFILGSVSNSLLQKQFGSISLLESTIDTSTVHWSLIRASEQGSFLYPTENQWQVLQNDL